MSKTTKPPKPPNWVTVREAAKFLDVTERGVRLSYVTAMSESEINRAATPMLLLASAVLEIALSRMAPTDADLAGEGGDSPALERYRLAKAKLAELDLATRKGQLIEVDKARELFLRWALLTRRMGERLGKRFGQGAAEIVTENLAACRSAVSEVAANRPTPSE